MTKLRTLRAPGCVGPRTSCRRSWAFPFRSSTAVASSSTALAFCPTAGPSPPWVSQDPGWAGGGGGELTGKGPGCELPGDTGLGQAHLCPHGAHCLDRETDTQADDPNMRQSGMRTGTDENRHKEQWSLLITECLLCSRHCTAPLRADVQFLLTFFEVETIVPISLIGNRLREITSKKKKSHCL